MANNSIVGLDLNIDHDFLSGVVRDVALAEIAAALDSDKHNVVQAVVKNVMSQKVDKDSGKPDRWGNGITLLEYYVRKMLTDEVREQVNALVQEKRPMLAEMIRAELAKQRTTDSFLDAFTQALTDAFGNRWNPNLTITFEKEKEDY